MTSLAHTVLQDAFGYAHFRGSQQAIVDHVIGGDDALVLMPTGGGKSLCYQIPAIVRQQQGHGTTIVISPLIALMHDQVSAMHEIGVDAAFLNSTLDYDQTRDVELQLLSGGITLLYVAPERLNTPRFLGLLDELHAMGKLALFAIDEAHCVSQWGHDFRPEYRELTVLHQRYAGVPRIALTATADALTRADIVERMQLESARVFISSFDRANIRYTIVEKKDAPTQLLRFIQREHDGDAGVVYCLSRKKVEEVAQNLCDAGVNALPYHAGLGAELRQKNQSRFLREEGIVMVATIAFGMGINKPDVRFVAHVDMPKNIESYYQETGRGGRDGLPANAWMAYGYRDVVSQRSMIDESPAGDAFKQVMRGKLDALLGLAEGTDCRRVRLLSYFGEVYGQGGDYDSAYPEASSASADKPPRYQCGNCDNCLSPPKTWDGTDAARKLLSTIYRAHAASQVTFGASHILDIVRGKETDKVRQFGHQQLSTFGLCQDYTEPQLRGVLRQLLAIGALGTQKMQTEAGYSFETLVLCDGSRAVLRGEQTVELRESTAERSPSKRQRSAKPAVAAQNLGPDEQVRFINLKAWRTEVAKEHNVPAYVVFADATLAAIAQRNPQSLDELQGVSGIGVKKLEAYGEAVLKVCGTP